MEEADSAREKDLQAEDLILYEGGWSRRRRRHHHVWSEKKSASSVQTRFWVHYNTR